MKGASLIGRLEIGTRVVLTNQKFNGMKATVKYIGPLDSTIQWVGVELDEEKGTHSGQYKGKSYFTCKTNHGAFVKPMHVTTVDGMPVEELPEIPLSAKKESTKEATKEPTKPKEPKEPVKKQTKAPVKATQPPPTTAPSKTRATVAVKKPQEKQKLANQLQNAMNAQMNSLRDQLKEAHEEIASLKDNTNYAQISKLREQVAHLEHQCRQLNLDKQKTQNRVESQREQKAKDLMEEITFYKNEKQKAQKEKKRMETRLKNLESSLEQQAGKQQLIEKMTHQHQKLESSYQALRQELQNAKIELKNAKILKPTQDKPKSEDVELLSQEIATLNQTVILLQSQLNEQKSKREAIQKEMSTNSQKIKDFTKLQKQLKKRQADIIQLKQALQQNSDAVAFAQQLSMRKLKVQEELQQAKAKINELLSDKQIMEQVQESQDELTRGLEHEINERDNEIESLLQKIKDKDVEITEHLKQNSKLKEKVLALLKQNENVSLSMKKIDSIEETKETPSVFNNLQYIEMMKSVQQITQNYLKQQNQFSKIKNRVGVYVLSMLQALPDDFSMKLYPQATELIITAKTAKDKLYFVFQLVATQLRERNELYVDENTQLANWMIILLSKIEKAYQNLYRIQLFINGCETEEQLAAIVTRRNIRQSALAIDNYSAELLEKLSDNSVSASNDFQTIDQLVKTLEEENNHIRGNLNFESESRLKMSSETMKATVFVMEMVLNYRLLSQLKQNAQIDVKLQKYLKDLAEYLRELCLNPHIRYRPTMKNYLEQIKTIAQTFKEIETQNLILNLQNLNTDKQQIKILKECLINVQKYVKQLKADLDGLTFHNDLQRLQTRLSGGVWRNRIQQIKQELQKVKQLTDKKNDLQQQLLQAKKKMIMQQKDIKDKGVVKEVLQKRIGQLQLRVQQISLLESEIKRLQDKLKNSQEGSKAMEDQIDNLIKKRSQVEDEHRKILTKYEQLLQTQGEQKAAAKMASTHVLSLDSVPVKNILKENSALRNVNLKEKIVKLKYSEILQFGQSATDDPYRNLRRQTLANMIDMKVSMEPVDRMKVDQLLVAMEKIGKERKEKEQVKEVEVGIIRVNVGRDNKPTTIQRQLYGRMRGMLPEQSVKV